MIKGIDYNIPSTQGVLGQRLPVLGDISECLHGVYQSQPTYFHENCIVDRPTCHRKEGPDPQKGRRDVRRCDRAYRTRG